MSTRQARFAMLTAFLLIAIGLGILVGQWGLLAAPSTVFPKGTYTTELTRANIPASFPAQFVPVLVGRYETTFAEGGRHTVFKEGQLMVEGRYATTQSQIVFYNDKGAFGCDILGRDPRPFVPPGTPATAYSGVYNWRFDGTSLTFTLVADQCLGRMAFFTARPLAKR